MLAKAGISFFVLPGCVGDWGWLKSNAAPDVKYQNWFEPVLGK